MRGLLLALLSMLTVATSAWPSCVSPNALAGGVYWNGNTFQVCDGTSYVSITGVVSNTTCTGRGGQFDRFGNQQYFCNGRIGSTLASAL